MTSNPWALVPVKRLSAAKSRLADAIDARQRQQLSCAMLEDVLGALSAADGLAGIRLVTSDPAVGEIGRRFGAETIPDRREAGPSAAIEQGIASLPQDWEGVLAVAADIPFVTTAEIEHVTDALAAGRAVIVPAQRDGGTNILAMCSRSRIALRFGPASLARHVEACRDVGVEPVVIALAGAGHDIDVEADLACSPHAIPAGLKSTRFLKERRLSQAKA